jgi:S1-C subfamily serine protease
MSGTPDFNSLSHLSDAIKGFVAKAAPHVVSIASPRSRSSGFLWRQGLVVTADEALADKGDIIVTLPGGGVIKSSIAGRDASTDVALLRLETASGSPVSLQPVPALIGALALVVSAEQGEPVAALGLVSRVSGAWRSMRGGDIDARIELDVSLRRSAEGGLALTADGHVLGMAVFGPRRRVLVIPAATIERVAAKLASHGRIARGYLGLGLQPVEIDGSGETGAMVMSVDPKGPGAAAGLQQGDLIVSWNGDRIGHLRALLRTLGPQSVGQTVTLSLRRAGDQREMRLTIGERPAD